MCACMRRMGVLGEVADHHSQEDGQDEHAGVEQHHHQQLRRKGKTGGRVLSRVPERGVAALWEECAADSPGQCGSPPPSCPHLRHSHRVAGGFRVGDLACTGSDN